MFSTLETPIADGNDIDNPLALDADQSNNNGDKENVEEPLSRLMR